MRDFSTWVSEGQPVNPSSLKHFLSKLKVQYKDVCRRTVRIVQRSHFKVNCCLKLHHAHIKLALGALIFAARVAFCTSRGIEIPLH